MVNKPRLDTFHDWLKRIRAWGDVSPTFFGVKIGGRGLMDERKEAMLRSRWPFRHADLPEEIRKWGPAYPWGYKPRIPSRRGEK
jgi:hypothetical protein